MAELIRLTDGSKVELDRHHWTGLATQESDSLTDGGRYVTPRLVALQHTDGRVLVYATVKDGDKISAAGGELLSSHDRKPIAAALGRLASKFSRGEHLLEECLKQIDGKGPVAVQ
jgi:hypothetical protein